MDQNIQTGKKCLQRSYCPNHINGYVSLFTKMSQEVDKRLTLLNNSVTNIPCVEHRIYRVCTSGSCWVNSKILSEAPIVNDHNTRRLGWDQRILCCPQELQWGLWLAFPVYIAGVAKSAEKGDMLTDHGSWKATQRCIRSFLQMLPWERRGKNGRNWVLSQIRLKTSKWTSLPSFHLFS